MIEEQHRSTPEPQCQIHYDGQCSFALQTISVSQNVLASTGSALKGLERASGFIEGTLSMPILRASTTEPFLLTDLHLHTPVRISASVARFITKRMSGAPVPTKAQTVLYMRANQYDESGSLMEGDVDFWPVWSVGLRNAEKLLHAFQSDLSLMASVHSGLLKTRTGTTDFGIVWVDPCDVFDPVRRVPIPGMVKGYHYS